MKPSKESLEQMLTRLLTAATQAPEGSPEKAYYQELIMQVRQIQVENDINKAQARVAGEPDVAGTAGITPRPAPQAAPVKVPTAPGVSHNPATATDSNSAARTTESTTKEDWIQRAMKANPKLTREQVEAEGKRLGKW